MRNTMLIVGIILLAARPLAAVGADRDAKRGAAVYRTCIACHSLEPGVHLTGPSLAALWGKRAASITDFPRYSKALQAQTFVWDEITLNAWVADPEAFVPGTTMAFAGVRNDRARADLIAFLRLALAPGGATAVLAQGLISTEMARGQVPAPLDRAGPEAQVVSVRHCRHTFFVVTADGVERAIWETNLRLKVDTSPNGPSGERPVLTQSGMQGDRASLVFSDPAQISSFVQRKC
jgi:cytochrome c